MLDPRLPGRPEGPLRAVSAVLLEHLEILEEQGGREEPARASVAADAVEKMVVASGGYDLPAYEKLTTLKVWAEGPPKGTLSHYPNPHNHQKLSIAASPAPPKMAQQIYVQANADQDGVRYAQGEKMEKALAWAEGECEGFMRS